MVEPHRASGDVVNQPADISFLISEMARLGADPASPYAGLVDGERIAVWRSSSSSP